MMPHRELALLIAGVATDLQEAGRVAAQELPEPDLPGGVAAVFRWLMHVPQPIQIGGAVLAGVLAIALAVVLVRKRREIRGWLAARRLAVQLGLAAVALAIVLLVAAFSYRVFDYTQHDNDFCTACHVMESAYERFVHSEHSDLLCHDCHQQPLSASMRQLYLWVLERPEEIGPHAPVPNAICVQCHVIDDPEETWQRVAATAGHRVHLESEERDLADVMCVTCHGQSVHEFVPADQTCGQAGCHEPAETRVVLGRMTDEAGLHCVVCHEFTAPVPEEAPADTALARLVPGESQCFGCHDMRELLAEFEPARDPHQGACGICHDPHTQERPAEAFATCTGAGCHDQPTEETPFHRGVHEAVLHDCGACHPAHDWVVEGTECLSCHPAGGVLPSRAEGYGDPPGGRTGPSRERAGPLGGAGSEPVRASSGDGIRTARALPGGPTAPSGGPWVDSRRTGTAPESHQSPASFAPIDAALAHPPVDVPLAHAPPAAAPLVQEVTNRPFDHETHRDLECTTCHRTERRHGEIAVGPAECFSCHHTSPAVDAGCLSCHAEAGLAGPRAVAVELFLGVWEAPRDRELPFDHARHEALECGECHTVRTLAPERECAACHADHHRAEADCTTCHRDPAPDAHGLAVHVEGCAGSDCHASTAEVSYGDLDRSRGFCLSCHRDKLDHEPGERCARCHLVPA